MRFLNIIVNFLVLQLAFGLIVTEKVSGGPIHISGVVHDHSSLNDSHISGAILSDINTPSMKTNISGAKKILPIETPESSQSKIIRKAKKKGIVLEFSDRPNSNKDSTKNVKNP